MLRNHDKAYVFINLIVHEFNPKLTLNRLLLDENTETT